MKFELTLDSVKRAIFLNYNRENKSSLVDKDYKIWYNSDTQRIVLERKDNGETPIKSSSIKRNTNRLNETD